MSYLQHGLVVVNYVQYTLIYLASDHFVLYMGYDPVYVWYKKYCPSRPSCGPQ